MKFTALLCLCAATLAAQSIRITSGAMPHQVFQRNDAGKADITLSGTAVDGEGKPVEAKLLRGIVPVFGFTSKKLGVVQNGQWTIKLTNIPTGGPYKLEVKIGGTKASEAIEDLLVGDIWVLGGQSNMEGVGNLENVQTQDDRVHTFDMVQERWQIAQEPLHNMPGAVDKIHWSLARRTDRLMGPALEDYNKNRKKGAGLGLPFAVAYAKASGVPVGLLPCAHGGTSMDQWDPAKWDKAAPGDSLYGSMMRRFEAAGGKVKGMLWYQGESDAGSKSTPLFKAKFENFIAKVREDFANPNLPFYFVQIGRHVNTQNVEFWNEVQEIQRLTETTVPNTAVFSAVDSDLDDGIHVSTPDLKRLGFNMAAWATGKAQRGPRPLEPVVDGSLIKLPFRDVNGKLASAGRPSGFTIHAPTGEALPVIYKTQIDGSTVLLHIQGKLPEGATLRYGAGKDPYCNIRDEQGFGLVVFGPLPLK